MIHESTKRPFSENLRPDTCNRRITGLRSSCTWREGNYIYSKVTLQLSLAIRRNLRDVLDLARGIDIIDENDRQIAL